MLRDKPREWAQRSTGRQGGRRHFWKEEKKTSVPRLITVLSNIWEDGDHADKRADSPSLWLSRQIRAQRQKVRIGSRLESALSQFCLFGHERSAGGENSGKNVRLD